MMGEMEMVGCRVLDLGCGDGSSLAAFLGVGMAAEAWGLDIARSPMLPEGRAVVIGTATAIPFPD